MESLGVVTDLAFGSESGDLASLSESARILAQEPLEFRENLREGLREGLSYPRARAAAMRDAELPATPNDLLGTEYLRALMAGGSRIKAHAVKRTDCRSASDIRAQMIRSRGDSDPYLCRDDFSDLLLHALCSAGSTGALSDCLDVSPDLAARIMKELPYYRTYSQFCAHVKTRNYTYTRISRALLHILLGMTTDAMERFDKEHDLCGWIRPIGFVRSAAPLLRSIAASCSVPYLDKLSKAPEVLPADLYALLEEELRAEFLYDLMAARRSAANQKDASIEGVPYGMRKPLITQGRAQD